MIDVDFDFRAEANSRDSDRWSPTLQEYHRRLWSKPLPGGEVFTLTKAGENRLHHQSIKGTFTLSSDHAVSTFRDYKKTQAIIRQMPLIDLDAFARLAASIGGRVLWPSNRIDGRMTINGAKGFAPQIADRLDLTIECIRRYYLGEPSPLSDVFGRYDNFFRLFRDFRGYIDFFLLQDAVRDDYRSVDIAPPYSNFDAPSYPANITEYLDYREHTADFLRRRNLRIDRWQREHAI